MNIELLRDFLVLSECRNFTRAAEKLHLTQPTLSKHIVSMERELGCVLLNRNRREVTLTPEGEQLAATAMEIVDSYDACCNRISKMAVQVPVRVGGILYDSAVSSITSIASTLIDNQGSAPVEYVGLAADTSFLNMLLNDEIDIFIGYATSEDVTDNNLERIPLTRTRYVAMVQASNPLARRKEISIDSLRNMRFIKYADNYSICGWNGIDKVCEQHGFTPRSRTVLGRNNSNYANIRLAPDEVVILPNNLPQLRYLSDFSASAVVPLTDDDAFFRLFAIYKKDQASRLQIVLDAYSRARKIIVNHGRNSLLVESD